MSKVTQANALENIKEFRVAIPDAEIADLKDRLGRTRWPNTETVTDWSQGVPVAKAKELSDHWLTKYDFRAFQERLNRFPQFTTVIDGLEIHFLHVKSKHPDALPILLTHGWPGSYVELLKVIEPLTNPEEHGGKSSDAFDVVIPSLPGFGFSGKPDAAGWNVNRIAKAWIALMSRLGYSEWIAQGGDWGAVITTVLAHMKPPGLKAVHLNWQFVFPEVMPEKLSTEEQQAVDDLNAYVQDGGGYNHLQTTRPQTVGYALSDSPVGQATWIYEKFQAWTDNAGNPEDALTTDEMLDVISLYWFTNSGASAARMYWENKGASFSGGKLDLPVAVTLFPRERPRVPEAWVKKTYTNLIFLNRASAGGHFAAFEQPQAFAESLRLAFRETID